MKITMYGAEICPDCVEAKELLKNVTNIRLEYKNITESTTVLKEFLAYRDKEVLFQEVKDAGKIGIPFFVLEDGTKTFDLTEFLEGIQLDKNAEENAEISNHKTAVNACSIDGTGC